MKILYSVEWFAEIVSGFKFVCYSRSVKNLYTVVHRVCEWIQISVLFTNGEESVYSRVVCRDCEKIQICMLFMVSEESVYSRVVRRVCEWIQISLLFTDAVKIPYTVEWFAEIKQIQISVIHGQ